MALVAVLCLRCLHYIYSILVLCNLFRKRLTCTPPQPLHAPRRRIPQHLSVLLIADPGTSSHETESCLVQSVINVAGLCREVGIEKLTVYEEHGTILKCAHSIRDSLGGDAFDESSSESDVEYPLTPPPSDYSDSRPISPQHGLLPQLDMHTVTINVSNKEPRSIPRKDGSSRRKNLVIDHAIDKPLTLCLASRESSKPAIASLAQSFASRCKRKSRKNTKYPKSDAFALTVDELNSLLESDYALSSPDFMIIHPINPLYYKKAPLELHGYPPWHIRLTEIYHNRFEHLTVWRRSLSSTSQPTPLNETTFNSALDEFTTAEMRFGK